MQILQRGKGFVIYCNKGDIQIFFVMRTGVTDLLSFIFFYKKNRKLRK